MEKKRFLKIPQNSQEKTCARVSFLIKWHACNFQMFKNNFFAQHLWLRDILIIHIVTLNYKIFKKFWKLTKERLANLCHVKYEYMKSKIRLLT